MTVSRGHGLFCIFVFYIISLSDVEVGKLRDPYEITSVATMPFVITGPHDQSNYFRALLFHTVAFSIYFLHDVKPYYDSAMRGTCRHWLLTNKFTGIVLCVSSSQGFTMRNIHHWDRSCRMSVAQERDPLTVQQVVRNSMIPI